MKPCIDSSAREVLYGTKPLLSMIGEARAIGIAFVIFDQLSFFTPVRVTLYNVAIWDPQARPHLGIIEGRYRGAS
jgi:hypothetical protein